VKSEQFGQSRGGEREEGITCMNVVTARARCRVMPRPLAVEPAVDVVLVTAGDGTMISISASASKMSLG
jgi:hypothetical protein